MWVPGKFQSGLDHEKGALMRAGRGRARRRLDVEPLDAHDGRIARWFTAVSRQIFLALGSSNSCERNIAAGVFFRHGADAGKWIRFCSGAKPLEITGGLPGKAPPDPLPKLPRRGIRAERNQKVETDVLSGLSRSLFAIRLDEAARLQLQDEALRRNRRGYIRPWALLSLKCEPNCSEPTQPASERGDRVELISDARNDPMRGEDLSAFLHLSRGSIIRLGRGKTNDVRWFLLGPLVPHRSDRRNGESNDVT